MEDKEYSFNDKTEKDIFFKFDTKNISNLDNFVLNFFTMTV